VWLEATMSEEEQGSILGAIEQAAGSAVDAAGKLGLAAGEASLGASEYGLAGGEHLLATGAEFVGALETRDALDQKGWNSLDAGDEMFSQAGDLAKEAGEDVWGR
jgi:hypothetical protein